MRPLIIALTATLALTAPASAHAFLDHAAPPVGSTMQKAPRSLSLWFTEDLEPAFSGATVTDTQGHTVDAGKSQVDPHNRRLMHVPVKALGPGSYRVNWHALSVDTHRTEGNYAFIVESR
jgi:methionine-rich copper-binding protein CopC